MGDVSTVFVTQYQAEVHAAYQQRGSKLRNTVRLKSGIVGSSTKFPKVGKGEANQKTRGGNLTPMEIDHSMVDCPISDWYAPDYVDKLDEFKINYDERQVLAASGAAAVGRKVDNLIITAATAAGLAAGNIVGDGSGELDLQMVKRAFARLNKSDVPDDGMRFAAVGADQWNQLLSIDQFAKSNYAGDRLPWLKGVEARIWLGITWMFHNGLPVSGAGAASYTSCMLWHKSALGLAENANGIISEINYVAEKASFLCNNMIGAGACRIDPAGIVVIRAKNEEE